MGKKITIASYDIDIKGIENKLSELRVQLNEDSLGGDFAKKLSKEISALEIQLEKVKNAYPGAGATQRQIDTYNKKMESLRIAISAFGKGAIDSFDDSNDYIKKNIKSLEEYVNKVAEASAEIKKLEQGKGVPTLNVSTRKGDTQKQVKAMQEAMKNGDREGVKSAYAVYSKDQNTLLRDLAKNKGKDSNEYKTALADREHVHQIEQAYLKLIETISKAKATLSSLQGEEADAILSARDAMTSAFQDIINGAAGAEDATKNAQAQLSEWSEETRRAEDASRAFDTIENKLKSLVSAGAVFGFLSRAVRNTIQDMLELDKQFNEIAIVSDYSTTEMWKSFDSVNRVAQEFGVETKNVLEVQNLYYHQGKSMAEVNKLTAQTLTLAKITGMDYADATSNLTAVLNAYNIAAEDAVRVTDTIAAMDTNAAISSEELMTALTKTASIAANAGMSLESTEVFLTKMIETTREAPENLGTALKTIIARFGEVKQEIDGEIIEPADINKVDTALKSVGISLLDSAGQIRDLDKVFMELSAQWDGLDRNTQRYIATIAAGSRQQSRFIAMMEDYDRTLELTNIAQNSAGIGARQLEKSQESLESSINRLKSSVQELAATWVKAGIIKDFIENVNNLVNAFNKVPPLLQPIVAGLALFILKYKILNPLLARYRILSEGFAKGTDTATMAEQLAQQKEIDRKVSLKNLIKTLTEAKDKTKELREETQRLKKEHAEAAAIEEARADSGINDSKGEYSERQREYEELFNSEEALKVSAEAGDNDAKKLLDQGKTSGAVVERVSRDALREGTGEVIEESTEKVAKKGIKNIGISLLDNVKGALTKAGKWLIAKVPAVFGKMSALAAGAVTAAVAAALIAAIAIGYAVWKTKFAASVDDTKKIEALTEAQDKYNESLQEYNNLQKNAKRYAELKAKTFKTAEELEEEQSVAAALVEEYPNLLDYIDEEGNYHLKATEYINQEIDAKKRLMEQNAETYNSLRLSNAKQGVYADESTAAGATMSNLQSYYASLGDEGIKDLRKTLDEIGTLDGGSFKKLAEAYASGEKASFNHKDFSNLFAGNLNEQEFYKLAQTFSGNIEGVQGGDIRTALEQSGAYTDKQINKIVAMWTELNEQTGGLYEQLLTNIGDEIENIYIQEARIEIEDRLGDTGINAEAKEAMALKHADISQQKYDEIYAQRKSAKDEAWANLGINVGSAVAAAAIPAALVSTIPVIGHAVAGIGLGIAAIAGTVQGIKEGWGNFFADPEKEAREAANKAAEEFTAELETQLSDAETVKAVNDFYTEMGSQSLDTIDDLSHNFDGALGQVVDKSITEAEEKLTKFKEDIKNLDITFYVNGEVRTDLAISDEFLNQLSLDEYNRFAELFAAYGNDRGAMIMKAMEHLVGPDFTGMSDFERKTFLSQDWDSIDSIIDGYERLGWTIGEDTELLELLIGAMGGTDAALFTSMEDASAKAQERLEKLTAELEKISKLASGEGDLSSALSMAGLLLDETDFEGMNDMLQAEQALANITSQFEFGADGIKFHQEGSEQAVTDKLGSASAMEYKIAMNTLDEIYEDGIVEEDEKTRLQAATTTATSSMLSMIEAQRAEFNAIKEGVVKALEKELDLLKKKRDAYKELVDYIRQYDYYQNLNREISELEFDKQSIDFEIEFSTNADVIVEKTLDQVNNINSQIAANQAGANAAKRNQAIYRDSIEKNHGGYVDFDATGTAIVNQQKMMDLQRRITEEKAAGHEETAALLENEKAAIEASVKAYDDALKASQDYTKKTQDGFKELEKVMKQVYQNYANAEEKIYEVIKENEDKQLDAIRDKYDAIKEENDKYLDNVRETIDKERELRDRAKSEEDVKNKEKKLAMMKMDTSGVYASDIMALEEELASDYQNLEDAAIDKKINEMENEFQTQADAYQKDIEYMENALEYKRQSYANYQQQVNEIIMSGTEAATQWLMQNDANYLAATSANQYLMQQEFKETMANGVAAGELISSTMLQQVNTSLTICKDSAKGFNEAVNDYYEDTIASNDEISGSLEILTDDYETLTGEVGELEEAEGLLEIAIGEVAVKATELDAALNMTFQKDMNRIEQWIAAYQTLGDTIAAETNGGQVGGEEPVKYSAEGKSYENFYEIDATDSVYGFGEHFSDKEFEISDIVASTTEGGYFVNVVGIGWVGVGTIDGGDMKNVAGDNGVAIDDSTWDSYYKDPSKLDSKKFKINTHARVYQFATGGLADYTGPAWLDGTRSKPEMVLNPAQTAAFIKLVDILDLINSPMGRFQSSYDNPKTSANAEALKNEYNFTINVDQMASDYDVDQLINRIEEKMIKASRYRNVTTLTKKTL